MATIRSASLASIASLLVVSLSAQQDTAHAHAAPAAPLLTGDRLVTELGAGVTLLDVDSLLREARSPRSVAAAGIFIARGGRTAARFSRQLPRGGLVRSALLSGRRGQRTVPVAQRQRARRSRLISVPPWLLAAVRRERVGREHLAAILGCGSMGRIRRRIRAARRRASPARNYGWSARRRAEPQLSAAYRPAGKRTAGERRPRGSHGGRGLLREQPAPAEQRQRPRHSLERSARRRFHSRRLGHIPSG